MSDKAIKKVTAELKAKVINIRKHKTAVSYTHLDVYKRQAYGSPGEEMRLFLTEDGYQAALQSQQCREIKIKRYARVIEGHILDFKPGKRRRS